MVTGAGGFIGSSLCKWLVKKGYQVVGITRQIKQNPNEGVELLEIDLNHENIPLNIIEKTQVIVHCAGRAHRFLKDDAESLYLYRQTNVLATERLAHLAAACGVQRFIFLSSVGVHGSVFSREETVSESSQKKPTEHYAKSKLEAEQLLFNLQKQTGMEVVFVRPPLVYGPNAPGNFGRLLRVTARGTLLPLGAVYNKRSFLALDNLISFIITCINHPAAANQSFVVADGEDLSTTELLYRLGNALGKPARLLPIPVWLIEAVATIIGKRAVIQRLCGSLQLDISKTQTLLGWQPPITVDEGLRRAAEGFLHETNF